MLVLSRRVGQEIVIDGVICVKVLTVRPDCIRLGIVAPTDVVVDRAEIHERRSGFGALETRSVPGTLDGIGFDLDADAGDPD
jgi:carbon storage regulator